MPTRQYDYKDSDGAHDITQLQDPLDLNQLYTFRGGEVLPFLDRRPFLAPLLFDAYGKIRNYFPSSRVFLEVVADSETVNSEQLVVFISTSLSADEAFVRLKRLDKDWWLGALGSAHGELCINVEFM